MVLTLYIDAITIVCCVSLIMLFFISLFCNPFLRGRRLKKLALANAEIEVDVTDASATPVSIVIPILEDAPELATMVETVLQQEYAAPFRVILVADKGNALVERLSAEHKGDKHLYCTFVPNSSRYMSRRKLAITLGVKAAQTEWIAITEPTCKPYHTNWLTAMAYHFNDSVGFVMGYAALSNDTPKFWQFEHAMQAYHRLCAVKHQHAWSTNSPNIALRKSMFMENDGFRNNLRFARGEYDFLVNEYACKTTTDIAITKEEWLYEDEQSKEEWRNLHTNFLAIRSKLHGDVGYRTKMFFYSLLPYISIIISFLGIAGGIIRQQWILLCASVLALLLLIILRTLLAKRVNKLLENPIGTASLFFHEIAYCWHSISYRFQYWRADKVSFSSHKL